MLVKLSWDAQRVKETGEDYVVIECKSFEHPMLPVWICTMKKNDEETPAIEGRYLNISQRGGISVGPKHT